MHLNLTLLNVIKDHLHEGWVSDHSWKEDFVNLYCTDWFYTAPDCFYAIENDATVYSNMLYFVTRHGHAYTNTVDLFNKYIYLYALHALDEDPDILEDIRNFRRIQQMRRTVPMVLNRYMQTDMVQKVTECLGTRY